MSERRRELFEACRADLVSTIIELEAALEYWEGYARFVDDCLDGQEYYEETLTKDDTLWRPES
jgi:hypothetical protein